MDNTSSYVELIEVLGNDVPNISPGIITERIRSILQDDDHPLVQAAIRFESNLVQRDDVLIAMAARDGIYIPPVDYGDIRAYYNASDGQYVVREYSTRLIDVAMRCREKNVSKDEIKAWIRSTPQEIANSVKILGIDIPSEQIDEENEYYQDRLSYYLRIKE